MMLHKSRCHGPTAREILYSPPTQKNNNPAINMRKTIDKRIENIMMKGVAVTGPLLISLAVTKSSINFVELAQGHYLCLCVG